MRLQFFGAAGEVTGSCTLIDTGKSRILVDCGMFQGRADAYAKNTTPFAFDPSSIDALIITHAHIDHIGRIPKLVKDGFSGRIFSTHPTRHLAPLMWEDAAKVMNQEEKQYHRVPLYKITDIPHAQELMHGMEYDTYIHATDDISFRFREAGHIFGSAFIEMNIGELAIVFSGDLGNNHVPILRATDDINRANIIIMESTYGDRTHDDPKTRAEFLKQEIIAVNKRKGTLVIPAFSLERTQEILYEINTLAETKQIPKFPIYLDSPLAIRALTIYKQFPEYYDHDATALKEAGDDFFNFPGLVIIENPEQSAQLDTVPSPKVIISGSGMMQGGRVMRHLQHHLNDPSTTVLIVGYQGVGTIGRALKEGVKRITIDHEEVEVRAEIKALGSYSAHADQEKLMHWVISAPTPPDIIYLNHGDLAAAQVLAQKIRKEYAVDVVIPKLGDAFVHQA
jgi:metallo-beta-lactamase family protein